MCSSSLHVFIADDMDGHTHLVLLAYWHDLRDLCAPVMSWVAQFSSKSANLKMSTNPGMLLSAVYFGSDYLFLV